MTSLHRRIRRIAGAAIDPATAPALKARILTAISKSSVLTALWYLPRLTYSQEQRAMLAGMAAYHRVEAEREIAKYPLRRSIHRIEKGLISYPRRPVFAEGFIASTVDGFERLVGVSLAAGRPPEDDPLARWSNDVLHAYFGAVAEGQSRVVDDARSRFRLAHLRTDGSAVPVPRKSGPPAVAPEQLLALATARKSVRRFAPIPVDRSAVDRAMAVAARSPSACNRQAFHFRCYDDPTLSASVAKIAPGYEPGPGGPPPMMIAVCGRYRAYYRERDQHVIYVDASLAAMAFILALETEGLSSCCINWPSLPAVDRRMTNLLGLESDEEVIMLMAVGQADPTHRSPHSEKASLDELRSYNQIGPTSC